MAPSKKSLEPNLDQVSTAKKPHQDGVVNSRTGVGTNRSKQAGVWYEPKLLNTRDAANIWAASDMAFKIVDLPAEEMTRAGISIRTGEDKEIGDELVKEHKRLKSAIRFKEAIAKTRCMGGAIVLVNVTDGITDARQPLNEAGLQSVDSLTVFEPGEAQAFEWISNPTAEDYGYPASYQISPRVIGKESGAFLQGVHHSRVIRFSGPMISRDMLNQNHGFGLSILDRVWEVIARFDQNYASAGALIDDFAQAVFKIKGLYKSMTNNGGLDVKKRLELMDAYRSMLRGIALDADSEEFDRKATPVSGLDSLIEKFSVRLAAAVNWPVTVLMGQSPSGLAATGDNDTLMWYDQIKRDQISQLQPGYERLNQLLMLAKKGPTNGKIVEGLEIEFNPLWQPSTKEQAETNQIQAQADQIYAQLGALDIGEIRKSRWGGAKFSTNTQIDNEEDTDADDLNDLEGTTRIDPATGLPVQVKPGQTQPAPVPGAPAAPGAKPMGPGGLTPADTAMNGIQVTSMVGVVTAVVKGEISRESGIAILVRAFRVSAEEAASIMGPENFEATPDPIELAKAQAPKLAPGVPGKAPPPKVDGKYDTPEEKLARRKVNAEVRNGSRKHPNDLPCVDCGHVWEDGERIHEYDHTHGYEGDAATKVESVCTKCHHARTGKRGA